MAYDALSISVVCSIIFALCQASPLAHTLCSADPFTITEVQLCNRGAAELAVLYGEVAHFEKGDLRG
jgi:hypothetical protein